MIGRRGRPTEAVSLFPFLSVLVCVIGTLALLIALSQIGLGAVHLDPEKYLRTRNEIADALEGTTTYKRLLAEAEQTLAALAAARAELARIESEKAEVDRVRRLNAESLQTSGKLRARIAELQEELRELEARNQALQEELAKRKQASEPGRIHVTGGGSGEGLKPRFIECTKDALILYNQGGEQSARVRKDDIPSSSALTEFLRRVRETPNATAVFLIRPDGVSTYDRVAVRARSLNVKPGKLPLPGQGVVDFSRFQSAGENGANSS